MRIAAHDKSNLAPQGKSVAFELGDDCVFRWKGFCDTTVDELLSGNGSAQTKTMQAESLMREMLKTPTPGSDVYRKAETLGISERTVKIAKKNLGVITTKENHQWIWCLSDSK